MSRNRSVRHWRDDIPDVDEVKQDLDRELHSLHEALREMAPIETGFLRGVSFALSYTDADGDWVGVIQFPAPYSIYHMNRRANPYDALVRAWEPRFEEVLERE